MADEFQNVVNFGPIGPREIADRSLPPSIFDACLRASSVDENGPRARIAKDVCILRGHSPFEPVGVLGRVFLRWQLVIAETEMMAALPQQPAS